MAIPIRRRTRPAPSTVATGTLATLVSFGADQPGTITLSPNTAGLPQNLTSIGAPVVYNVTGNLLTAFVDTGPAGLDAGDRQVFTLQITNPATGAYTFTLLDQLDHGLGTNDNDEALIAINLSSILVATDADGDFVPLTGALHDQCRERHSAAGCGTVARTVYEDLLTGGNPDTPANPAGAVDGCDGDAGGAGVVWRRPARDHHAVAEHVGSAAEPDVDWCACCLQRHRQPADGVC